MRKRISIIYVLLLILLLSTLVSCGNECSKGLEFQLNEDETEYIVIGYSGKSEDIIIPNCYRKKPVRIIGEEAFKNKSWIRSVYIPGNVRIIEKSAFYLATSLQYIEFDEDSQLETIEERSFRGSNLLYLDLPNSVKQIGDDCFSFNRYLYKLTLSKELISIGERAFFYCRNIMSVQIPDSVQEIGEGAFAYCEQLKSINIPKSVEVLFGTFEGCINLRKIIFDDNSNLRLVDRWIFAFCSDLKNLILPSSLEEIGIKGLGENFETITFLSVIPPKIYHDSLGKHDDMIIYVPPESIENYKAAWIAYVDKIQPISN